MIEAPEKRTTCPICQGTGKVLVRLGRGNQPTARPLKQRPWIGPVPCAACLGRGGHKADEQTAGHLPQDPDGRPLGREPGIPLSRRIRDAEDARKLGNDQVWRARIAVAK